MTAAALFLAAFLAFIPWLDQQYLWAKDEVRPALVVKEMLATGEWAIPRIGGRVYVEKPPLFMWVVALLSPGGVTAWSLRLPAAAASAATVAVAYLIAARLVNRAAGVVAAAALASSFTVFQWARTGRMESLLTLWITLGFWSLLRWLDTGHRRDAATLGLWVGLGLLTKGPAALIPLAAAALALASTDRGRARMSLVGGLWAVGTAAGVLAVWLTVAAVVDPDLVTYVTGVGPQVAREVRRPDRPATYAVEVIAGGFFPWSALLPVALVLLARAGRPAWFTLRLPLLWAALVLLIFAVLISPREVYFLPVYPALAIIVGWAWARAGGPARWWLAVPLVLTLAAVAGAAVLSLLAVPVAPRLYGAPVPITSDVALAGLALAAATALGALALLRAARPVAAASGFAAGVLAILLLIETRVHAPAANRAYPAPPVAARLAAHLPPGARVAYVDRGQSVALVLHVPRPSIQLGSVEAAARLAGDRDLYVLVPEAELGQGGVPGLAVRPVDRVELHRTWYVLAALEPR
jgi:4-amino-4-deoxy-L-arabinose transferase-like glycosyltransferase